MSNRQLELRGVSQAGGSSMWDSPMCILFKDIRLKETLREVRVDREEKGSKN
jgi:hypothetical protein